ncbi:MAG TPA: DUF5684 domain-containing protein [Polyangiaceae bacterium]|nr:DUF5684 domain-containing protein [Polyangiaceae bacterium]
MCLPLRRIFVKAGRPAWEAFVPFYQSVVMARVALVPEWLLIAYFLPHSTAVVIALISCQMARVCGKLGVFQILTLSLPVVFIWLLAFEPSPAPRFTNFEHDA